jgi:hypothetical protein
MNTINEDEDIDLEGDDLLENPTSIDDESQPTRRITNVVDPALDYILTIILGFDEDSDVHQALQQNGVLTVYDLLSIGNNMFPTLEFQAKRPPYQRGGRKTASKLKTHEVAMLRHATNYIRSLKDPAGRLLARSYASLQANIRREAFDDYRISTRLDEQGYPLTETTQTTPQDTSFGTLSRTSHDILAALDKKIKLDSDAFPILRKEEHFETWVHAFTAQCRLQGTHE